MEGVTHICGYHINELARREQPLMDGEENLDIYRLVTMSEEEIEGLEYTPDGMCANMKPTELICSLKAQVCNFMGLYWLGIRQGRNTY